MSQGRNLRMGCNMGLEFKACRPKDKLWQCIKRSLFCWYKQCYFHVHHNHKMQLLHSFVELFVFVSVCACVKFGSHVINWEQGERVYWGHVLYTIRWSTLIGYNPTITLVHILSLFLSMWLYVSYHISLHCWSIVIKCIP